MKLFTKIKPRINKRIVLITLFFLLLAVLAFVLGLLIAKSGNVAVLEPKGAIGQQQRNLIIFATLLSLIVVLPVYVLTFWFAYRYRAGNSKSRYRPDFDGSRRLETIWWGVPLILIIILSVVTFKSSHDLDPHKPLAENQLRIQVVSMNWKWLFIYPEQQIATVNYLQIPVDQPVEFEITGDSAMNSFWIPELGGQIYAMPGMATHLHLKADEVGTFRGSSANISGEGFAGMKFKVKSTTDSEFSNWIAKVKSSSLKLDESEYTRLAQPSQNNPPALYALRQNDLFESVIRKYLEPS